MTRRIGLTGGIACGKTEAAQRMSSHGIPILDTDKVAHEVMTPGTEVFEHLIDRFGQEILNRDGTLCRSRLAEIVFSDEEALRELNRLVHPEVGRRWRAWLTSRTGPAAVVAIPLLVETGCQREFDDILCISSSKNLMRRRLASRGLTPGQAEQRIQSQLPLEEKEKVATWILTNNGSLAEFHRKVDQWISDEIHLENT